ncbi:MAG TPA: hypothetical protein VFD71_13530, partial [Planctomycetota bacterium]|nr:hypothetical protein [Planctomycetota bacterium]
AMTAALPSASPAVSPALSPAVDGESRTKAEESSADSPRASLREVQARVPRAVDRGREELLRRLDALLKNPAEDYPAGRLALPLAALLKAGADPADEKIGEAFERLASMKIEKTYCAACVLFALDALAKSSGTPEPRAAPRTVVATAKNAGGSVGEDLRARIKALTRWLLEARIAEHGSWTYAKPRKASAHDFSNTQFAVLGLQVGLEHGAEVPAEVFSGLIRLFSGSITREGSPVDASVQLESTLEARLHLTRVAPTLRFRAALGGWGYTDPRRGKGERDAPYPSMTAAGASSLVIALRALSGGGALAASGARAAESRKAVEDGERALQSAYAWISRRFDEYLAGDSDVYYTLYSLEKLGDLAGLERFGDHDWYVEGAAKLLDLQKPNGSWGTYVNTSLALLFLTRANRPLEAVRAPVILTAGGKGEATASKDLVYVERAQGFLSASAVLKYAASKRKPELVPLGEDILRNYAPDAREELVPLLLELWSKPDSLSAFARRALAEVSGEPQGDRQAYARWYEAFTRIRALDADASLTPERLEAELRSTQPHRLKAILAGMALRHGFRSLARALVEQLETPSIECRRSIHGVLSAWTGITLATPARDTQEGWQANAKAWQEWWARDGTEWEAAQLRARASPSKKPP